MNIVQAHHFAGNLSFHLMQSLQKQISNQQTAIKKIHFKSQYFHGKGYQNKTYLFYFYVETGEMTQ